MFNLIGLAFLNIPPCWCKLSVIATLLFFFQFSNLKNGKYLQNIVFDSVNAETP